jgi:hypothetical protein
VAARWRRRRRRSRRRNRRRRRRQGEEKKRPVDIAENQYCLEVKAGEG